MNDEENYGNIV